MNEDTLGSIVSVNVDGVPYDTQADANFTQNNSKFENEPVPSSGRTRQKMTRRAQTVEGVALATNESEDEDLKNRSDTPPDDELGYPLSYVTASGATYRTTGYIRYEARETDSGTTTIQLIPIPAAGWQLFKA